MNVINFSGGRTSAYMAKRLIDEGLEDYIVTFQNTGKEMPQTLEFVNECDKRWGLNILWLEYRKPASFAVVDYETASRNGSHTHSYLSRDRLVFRISNSDSVLWN